MAADVPEDLARVFEAAAADVGIDIGPDAINRILAVLLPRHAGQICERLAASIEEYGDKLMGEAIDLVIAGGHAGEAAVIRAATVVWVAKLVRGQQ